jgi:transcriptional regulator of acetoin/glycerol metabolism
MIGLLFKKVRHLLLPERNTDNTRPMTATDLLVSLCEQISRLAAQLEAHAERAPYPQVTDRLRAIADEKRSIANLLKEIGGNAQESSRRALNGPPGTGKNHWERLIRDLEEQRALDDFLVRYQSTLIQQFPRTADLFERIKVTHEAHRRSLLKMIAVADPQANQS